MKEIDVKVKRILGKYYLKEPVFSKIKWIDNLYYSFWRYYYKITSLPFKVKYFIQRHIRGYDDLDKWNAAWYISRKAAPVLRAMRKKFYGTSIKRHREDRFGNIVELTEDEIFTHSNEKDFQEPVSFTEDEWGAILDDIIFAFQFQIDFDSEDGTIGEADYREGFKRQKRGLKLFCIYFNNLWD